jgi:hypothetical protein
MRKTAHARSKTITGPTKIARNVLPSITPSMAQRTETTSAPHHQCLGTRSDSMNSSMQSMLAGSRQSAPLTFCNPRSLIDGCITDYG